MLGPKLSKNQIEAVKQAQSDSNNPQGFPVKTPVSDKNPIEKAHDAIDRLKRREDRDRLHGCIFKNIGCMGLDPLELLVKIVDGDFEPCRDVGICQKDRCNGCCTNEPCCGIPPEDCNYVLLAPLDLWSDVDSFIRPPNDIIGNIKAPEAPKLEDIEFGVVDEYMDAYSVVCSRGCTFDTSYPCPDDEFYTELDTTVEDSSDFAVTPFFVNDGNGNCGWQAIVTVYNSELSCEDISAGTFFDGWSGSETLPDFTFQKQSLPPISGQQKCGSFWRAT